MKTLDEVIEELNIWDAYGDEYPDVFYDTQTIRDALYYLKMYRSDMQMYSENQKYWEDELKQKIKDFGDAKDRYIKRLKELEIGTLNDPLDWETLKTMEGKPVWVEEFFPVMEDETGATEDEGSYEKYWAIIDKVEKKKLYITWRNGNYQSLPLLLMGEQWQAYRKERK